MNRFLELCPILLVRALAGLVPAIAAGQTAPMAGASLPAPPVEELVAQALHSAPTLAAMQARLNAAREMIAPAGALSDPMVEVMLQDMGFPKWTVGSEEMSMIGPEIRQELPYRGKRAARRDAAGAEATVRAVELEQLQLDVAARVRTLYARVYALDSERKYLAAAHEMLDMLAAMAATRYSVGEAEQEAVIKAQLEVSRLAERLDDVTAERSALVAALNRLLDQPGAAPLGQVSGLPTPGVPAPPWEDLAVKASPEVARRQASVTAAEKRLAVARLDLRPDFTTGAALGLRGGFDPAVTLRFGVVYPLWKRDKQKPVLRAAEDELEMFRAELHDAEATARSEAARLAADWRRATRQIERYQQALVPQSSAAVDAARAAYLVGRGDFLTVADDFDRWLDARVGLARREADRFATWAEVEALIASPPAEQEPKEK